MSAKLPLASIDIFPDSIMMTEHGKDGMGRTWPVSPEGLAQAVAKDFKLDTGLMPTLHGVVRYVRHNSTTILYYQVPEHKRSIVFRDDNGHSTTYPNCKMPWSLFVLILRADRNGTHVMQDNGWVYAAKGPILTPTDNVYRYPYTNVENNGHICHGSHDMPRAWKNIAGASGFAEQFFSSNFNHHLDHGNYQPFEANLGGHKVRIDRVHSLFKFTNESDVFPYSQLINPQPIMQIQQRLERDYLR